ncbi:MAG: efflux RND transporter periplasmic adaptor subunit, partial [Chthoniobacteraceae bacterium]
MKKLLFLPCLAALFATLSLSLAPRALAHAGHDKAPGEDGETAVGGPIAISAEAKTNLALKVEEVELRTLEKTFTVIGQIEVIPSRRAAVSSRIAGRVVDIKATEGETVKKGQTLVEIESRQVGNPPPRVQYPAPIDGVVTHRDVLLNDSVEPDKHLLEISDLSEVYAEGQIFEGQVAQVKLGQKVRVSVESFPGETFSGTVDLLSGALDPETRTLKVWVRVPNADGKLRPNMRATLHIVTDQADSVTAIPHSAVLGEAGNLFAFVQADDDGLIYERRAIVTGIKDDQYVEVIEGIFPSDKVVTLGNYQLQYVTTKPKPKPAPGAEGAEHKDAPGAAPHEHGATEAPHGIAALTQPLMWMGGTIIALLVLNLLALLFRRRPAVEHEPEPAKPAAP